LKDQGSLDETISCFHRALALPLGVSFVDNHNGTATLSGKPLLTGVYTLTIRCG
jgi:hypothetical protein